MESSDNLPQSGPATIQDDQLLTTLPTHNKQSNAVTKLKSSFLEESTAGRELSLVTSHTTFDTETDEVTTSPLWWPTAPRPRHDRSVSSVSDVSLQYDAQGRRLAPIQLQDRSDEGHELNLGCWARSVTIDDYILVGEVKGVGAYIVWHCTVHTLSGGDLSLRKRYSEFDRLRSDLVRSFPHAANMIPALPRKSVVSRFRSRFLEQRQAGLSHFLK